MSQASPQPFAPEQLLKLGVDSARNGNRQAARSLFLALSREFPADPRVWVGLAGVAASRNEQREALERIVALDPGNQRALAALQRLHQPAPAPQARVTQLLPETRTPLPPATPPLAQDASVVPHDPAPASAARDDEAQAAPFPLLNLIAIGLILLLLVALGVVLGRALLGVNTSTPGVTLTPALGTQPDLAATPPTAPAADPSALPASSAPAAPPAAAPTSAPPPTPGLLAPSATLAPLPVATQEPAASLFLPLGTPLQADGWEAVLVRPDDALPLDGAIGDLQPLGRFVLAVVAVSNNSPTPRVIPPQLFVLVDSAGRTYSPVPGASTAYLNLYERAQRGDLALEDSFEPVVALRSVPLIFDVPLDATGLRLTVNGAGPAGWPVGETQPASAPVGP